MRAVGYVRVSTAGQVKDGLGIPTQERMVQAWAQAGKHRLIRVVQENGKSGTLDETQRPGLLEALSSLRTGEADALVVTSLDRLARALTIQEAILAQVWQAGGRVFTADGGEVLRDDPDDPMRTFVRQVMGAVAQLERGMIVKRLRAGRQTKASRGGYAVGAPPYGWRANGGALVVVPEEQRVLAEMRELRARGESLARIAETLNAAEIPARRGRWHGQTVARALAREPRDRRASA